MSNNTSIDPIEHKSVKVKSGNMCKVRNHLTNLYKKYGIVAEAINLIIGEDDDTPTIIDNLSETIEKVRKIDGVEVSHIGLSTNHIADPFSFSDSFVRLNWDCYNLGESNEPTSHYASIPVATRTNAGILNSSNYRKLDNIGEYTNIYHTGGSSGHTQTWSGDDSNVYLQFSNTNPSNKNTTEYNATTNKQAFPVASTTKAGIITAEMYRNLNNWFSKDQCSENKINTYEEVLDFLDGVENTSSSRDIYIFEGHVNAQDFTIQNESSFTSIEQKDLIFWCNDTIYVIDGEICRDAHFYGRNGRELTPEKLEPVVFQIVDQNGITYLNEIEGEPVVDVVFKTSSSSDVSWRLEALRQRIGFITNVDGPRGLADASTLFSQNNTINIARRASFPVPLQSRLTGITDRLTTVEQTGTNLGNNKVNITETVPYGQGNITTFIDRGGSDTYVKLFTEKKESNNAYKSQMLVQDQLVDLSSENVTDDQQSSVKVFPASVDLVVDNGPSIELAKGNDDNEININSETINTESDNYLITNNDTFIVTGPSSHGQFLQGSKLTIDQNNGVNVLCKTAFNDNYVTLINSGAQIGSSHRDQSNSSIQYSSVSVYPTSITLQANNATGPEVNLENSDNSNNVNINSDKFVVKAIGNVTNAGLYVNQSQGVSLSYNDGTNNTSVKSLDLIEIQNKNSNEDGTIIITENSNGMCIDSSVSVKDQNDNVTQRGISIDPTEIKTYTPNLNVTLNNSTGLKINFSDGSYVQYKNDGTQYDVYNLTQIHNYLNTNLIRGGYNPNSTYQDNPAKELNLNLPFYVLSGINAEDIIPDVNPLVGFRGNDYILGFTNDFQKFKIYKERQDKNTPYTCYFQIDNDTPVIITNTTIGGLGSGRNFIKLISVTN